MSLLAQTVFFLAGTLLIYGLAWVVARLLLRLVGSHSRAWAAGLPWACLQCYLVAGLFVVGALPASARGLLAVLAVTGAASLAVALARRRPASWRVRAILLAWAVPWLAALAYIVL